LIFSAIHPAINPVFVKREEMGISKGNLSDIERGKRDPRYSTLKAIAEGLEVPLSQLVKGLE